MATAKPTDLFIDPVCGMRVHPDSAGGMTSYQGTKVYFCARGCQEKFEAAPHTYPLKKRKGFWQRYLERLNKATGGKPPSCCQ